MAFYASNPMYDPMGSPAPRSASESRYLGEWRAAPSAAWAQYHDRRRTFSTAFWLHYIFGLAGAHRFYVRRNGSAWAQFALGLGSILAILATISAWGAGAIVFFLPLSISGLWTWWDGYNLREMVGEHNRTLARRVGLKPSETEEWERAQARPVDLTTRAALSPLPTGRGEEADAAFKLAA